MALSPRAPVLVGVGTAHQHFDDPAAGRDAIGLMIDAVRAAADDAGVPGLPAAAQDIAVPAGTWSYTDPGALIAAAIGASARTTLAGIGILQQTLVSRAATAIARGDLDVALVVGGEAKYRELRGRITGRPGPETVQSAGVVADEQLVVTGDIISTLEIERGLGVPAHQYALIESARRAEHELSIAHARDELAAWWSAWSLVAAANDDAWRRDPIAAAVLAEPSAANPMLASPYTKLHCSQWNVDQAAALILCSVAAAQRFGVPRERWIFPWAAVESNATIPLSERAALSRSAAVSIGAAELTRLTGFEPRDGGRRDLYSCFPAAVAVQADELALKLGPDLTVTGGMRFAGGPLNNYTVQAMARLAKLLRATPAVVGHLTSISGMITKHGQSFWSASEPAQPFACSDISARVAAATETRPVDAAYVGPGTVAAYTVVHDGGLPAYAIVLADTPDGTRALAMGAPSDLASGVTEEWIGRTVHLDGAAFRF